MTNSTYHRLPEWLRRPSGSSRKTESVKRILRKSKLNTVCEEARCPNITECFSRGTATFMILGDVCTRGCKFCSVTTGKPVMKDIDFKLEAKELAMVAASLRLKHVVITSVARDDLPDGGSLGFANTIYEVRDKLPAAIIEVLIPDFRGKIGAIENIVKARPDVLNHNLETIPRLYRRVRPGASFQGSLNLLAQAKNIDSNILTKSGIMLGLGEDWQDICQVLHQAADHGVDIFTAGQYMRPSLKHLEVSRYVTPSEFQKVKDYADERKLFKHIFSGPLVRSSYHAEEEYQNLVTKNA